MENYAVVGINWGDEGKGRMVDLLTSRCDVVVRYQGGGNAGHTVINDMGKFALHLLPSGVFRPGVMNVLGSGVALDPENLLKEIGDLAEAGVSVTPDNLMISERASILFPWHRDQDALEESRLGSRKYGSTKQGIAPFYSDKSQKKTVLAGELRDPEKFRSRVMELMEWKNLLISGVYGAAEYTAEEIDEWISMCCEKIRPFIGDTGAFLGESQKKGKSILYEAQLGALRDLDYGIYPYTTSSNTLSSYIPIGSGFPGARVDSVIGVVKAYSTCVGEGPFVSEMSGEEADRLREAGAEYGAKTGRARRVGALDLVATRYGVRVQNATEIALTKLDILSLYDKIPVCTGYMIDGERTDEFPFPSDLDRAEPCIEYMPGWKCDISAVRTWDGLPEETRNYVTFIERELKCPVTYISVGPERESIIVRD